MKALWQKYSNGFLNSTPREQYLIIFAGISAIVLIIYSNFIDPNLIKSASLEQKTSKLRSDNNTAISTIEILEQSLANDVNVAVGNKVERVDKVLLALDDDLLALTSGLINPLQMRYALVDLLQLQQNLTLNTFEVLSPEALTVKNANKTDSDQIAAKTLTLYKHPIKLVISGSYFQLRDYLVALEELEWRFFWRTFDYRMNEYPMAELHIELYSLSTKREFLGV